MQVLKKEVKEKILSVAKEEFKSLGYNKASLRNILKGAGTTIGNFYNYFENKEDLYNSIVDEAYLSLLMMFSSDEDTDLFSIDYKDEQINSMLDEALIPLLSDEIYILLTENKDTKYEGLYDNVLNYFKNHLLEHLNEFGLIGEEYEYLADACSSAYIQGVLRINESDKKQSQKLEALKQLTVFQIGGIKEILSYKK